MGAEVLLSAEHVAARLTSVMRINAVTSCERNAFTAVLPGVFLAMVALAGLDAGLGAGTRPERHQRSDSVVLRLAAPVAASSCHSHALACSAGAVILLLWIGRRCVCDFCRPVVRGGIRSVLPALPASRLLRQTSISYHLGGLYGP